MTLIGFSLGGRIALGLLQYLPEKTGKLILMAPDGLKVNFWYWLSTQTWLGNKFFAFTMKRPGWFFLLLRLFNALRLVNASIFKFVNYYIGDKEVRRLLYQRWTTLRKIKPDLALIKSTIRKNNINSHLIYGVHDRIILSSVGEKFKKGIEDHCTVTIIQSGHQVLHEKHVNEILPALTS
jgi:pimeloyl-ACP methyl ester carboxylesterase